MSDDDLLRGFRSDVPEMTDASFAAGRARLTAAIGPGKPVLSTVSHDQPVVIPLPTEHRSPPTRRAAPWLVAAAAVAVVGVGAVMVMRAPDGVVGVGGQPTTTSTSVAPGSSPVNPAGDLAAAASDVEVPAGKYRYVKMVTTQAKSATGAGGSMVDEHWAPGTPGQDWLHRKASQGGIQGGNENNRPTEERGTADEIGVYELDALAALPSDPAVLYRDTQTAKGDRAADHLVGLLRSSWATAPQRAVLLGALGYFSEIGVLPDQVTADGRAATAVTWRTNQEIRHDLLIDPANARVIGYRNVAMAAFNGFTKDQEFMVAVFTDAVVPVIGDRP
ncbi:hypothetical protein SAMN05192558_10974 [Actinokineospora alba]|uniref:CU044_5270 family protein n=1 Tax=Actinokineospora alba TaxID=504798 RepID=A0A1H0SSE6_9PSEU|nr:hypothetical protein [Actinokineospora alba]TDP66559.1 hypothetical protein C8E96_2070 [Actinokineospora alba]SDJ37753.1 hypothetical protein SAMN05421871_11472 [Actinokineospora alba]SDP44671.1 hypothetical protein SAMN05192558_10974 [Actinokineospora alba]